MHGCNALHCIACIHTCMQADFQGMLNFLMQLHGQALHKPQDLSSTVDVLGTQAADFAGVGAAAAAASLLSSRSAASKHVRNSHMGMHAQRRCHTMADTACCICRC